MSSIGRIHHVGLTVSDLDRSVAFYTELLGCTQVMGQEKRGGYLGAIVGYPDAHVRMAHLKAAEGDFIIELFEYHQPTPTTVDWEPRVIGCPHVCFLVTDLTAIHHRLVDSGVRFISAPTPIDTGANAGGAGLYLCDPDGIIVELFQRAPAAAR
jgi:catechol 2,3-dioxygenase-like lactoylglutathione lyase family enzyme